MFDDRIINAAGKMTVLGGSASCPQVAQAMAEASQKYYVIDELMEKVGEEISKKTGAEAGLPTSSASAGISLSVSAVCNNEDLTSIETVPFVEDRKEIIIQKGHVINFGAPITQLIKMGGGLPVEVGTATNVQKAHVEGAINEHTAALIYVQSHHAVHEGMVSLEDYAAIARAHDLPLVIDAAAEQDLRKYIEVGASLVIYSGSKAIGGPASGFVAGKSSLVRKCNLNYHGIGRPMKIGKETLMGLLTALQLYDPDSMTIEFQEKILEPIHKVIDSLDPQFGIGFAYMKDEAGRAIVRGQVKFNTKKAVHTISEFIDLLEVGKVRIFTRKHTAELGYIQIDPRTLLPGDNVEIANKFSDIFDSWECTGK